MILLKIISDQILGEYETARQNVIDGRNLALDLDDASQLSDYQIDLSDVERQTGDAATALAYLREAGEPLATVGNQGQIKRALERSAQLMSQLDTWDALSETLLLASAVLPALETADRATVCAKLVHNILSRIRKEGWQTARDGLVHLASDLKNWLAGAQASVPKQVQFLSDFVNACLDYSGGARDSALETMRRLDAVSACGFHLAEFLSQPAEDSNGTKNFQQFLTAISNLFD